MQSTVLFDQFGFSFQADPLFVGIEMCVDAIDNIPTVTNNLADNIALERIAFSDWMISTRLCFMLKHAAVESFSDIEGASVRTAQKIDIVPTGN